MNTGIFTKFIFRLPINVYTDDDGIEEFSYSTKTELNSINQNIKYKCVSAQPDIFIAEAVDNPTDNNKKECVIRLRENIKYDQVNILCNNIEFTSA